VIRAGAIWVIVECLLWTGTIVDVVVFVILVTAANFPFQIEDMVLQVVDVLLMRINWSRIDPLSEPIIFFGLQTL
jgi:hypothetical protein